MSKCPWLGKKAYICWRVQSDFLVPWVKPDRMLIGTLTSWVPGWRLSK